MNEYKRLFHVYGCGVFDYRLRFAPRDIRQELVHKYAYAVPTQQAIDRIHKFAGSIVEIGAGTGYWAMLLAQAGVEVHAYDNALRDSLFFPVQIGSVRSVQYHPEAALMLCWPPYRKQMANNALRSYQGSQLIYIGEDDYGCCANDAFFNRLEREWNCVDTVSIPQWDSVHDYVWLYERRLES